MLCSSDSKLCRSNNKLCSSDSNLCSSDGKLTRCNGKLCSSDSKLCSSGGQLKIHEVLIGSVLASCGRGEGPCISADSFSSALFSILLLQNGFVKSCECEQRGLNPNQVIT